MNQTELEALKEKAALSDRLLVALENIYNAMMAVGTAASVEALKEAQHQAVLVMLDANKKPEEQ